MRNFDRICRLTELNCPLILTMDLYYHYTKSAESLYMITDYLNISEYSLILYKQDVMVIP